MKTKHLSEAVFVDKTTLLKLKQKAQNFFIQQSRLPVDVGLGDSVSPFKTKGLDFQEVRVYQPGDDIRFIDWRITAKQNKPYTKLYTDEKERQIFILADMRTSMKFATKGVFKSVIVAKSAALLSFLAENKNDKIGFAILGSDKTESAFSQSGAESGRALIEGLEAYGTLENETINEEQTLLQTLTTSERLIRKGSMVFVLSDFSDMNEECSAIIKRIARKSVCSLVHIYDILEKEFPKGVFPISDGETISYIDVSSSTLQKRYKEIFNQRVEFLHSLSKSENVGYLPLKTTDDFMKKIIHYCKGGLV